MNIFPENSQWAHLNPYTTDRPLSWDYRHQPGFPLRQTFNHGRYDCPDSKILRTSPIITKIQNEAPEVFQLRTILKPDEIPVAKPRLSLLRKKPYEMENSKPIPLPRTIINGKPVLKPRTDLMEKRKGIEVGMDCSSSSAESSVDAGENSSTQPILPDSDEFKSNVKWYVKDYCTNEADQTSKREKKILMSKQLQNLCPKSNADSEDQISKEGKPHSWKKTFSRLKNW